VTPDTVIDFWLASGEGRWFTRNAAFDGELSVHFKEALARARDGAFDHWTETPKGTLALLVLLDQFSRNIHRGTPLAFAAGAALFGAGNKRIVFERIPDAPKTFSLHGGVPSYHFAVSALGQFNILL
jgi:uncharacterized protein (DUF924 family)